MLRSLGEVLLLFTMPFMLYFAACFAVGHPLNIFAGERRKHLYGLIVAGLLTAIMGILILGFFEPHKMGAFQPAHMENGKLIDSAILPERKK